tara:strand:+ start:1320 stop:1967 length:648 start_codon:yes stop_codon:yes gene_type:complete
MTNFRIILVGFFVFFEFSFLQGQSVVTKEYYDNRFVQEEIGLPDNMPYTKSLIWGEEGLFRKWDIGPDTRIEELKLRRKMLQTHQWLGVITLTGLAYQYSVGKKLYDDNGSTYWDKHYDNHKAMGYFTYTTYMTGASLAIFAPPARKYDSEFSSIKLHRTLAILHFSAMVAQPFLAKNAVKNGKQYDDLMDAHLKAGTVAFFTLSLDMLGLTLFK